MALNPQLIPVKKDPEIIRTEVLTNCVKMFFERGYINNIGKAQKDFAKISDTDTYLIKLDSPILPDMDTPEYKKKFNSNVLAVKIIHQKILGITKLPNVKEFLDNYSSYHKVFIFDGISDKAKQTLMAIPNTEVFTEPFLMINLLIYSESREIKIKMMI
jgi:hypothetical protein